MDRDALLVIPRDGSFLLISPALGVSVEHADLNYAYHLLAERHDSVRDGTRVESPIRRLMPFFVKAATVALVGAFLMMTAGVAISYALQEPVRKAGQKAARAALANFERGMIAELATAEPERRARIVQAIREAVPQLKPYADELKPLFQ